MRRPNGHLAQVSDTPERTVAVPFKPFRLGIDGRVLDDRYHGIGRVTEALLRQLAGRSDVDVVVFLRPGQGSRRFDLVELTEGSGHAVVLFDCAIDSPLQWLRWPAVLAEAAVDSVLFPYNLGAAVWGHPERYTIVHDCILESDVGFAPDPRTRRLYMLGTRMILRRNRIITPSRASADALQKIYAVPEDALTVIPWGVDPAFSEDGLETPRTLDDEHPAPSPGTYLLHVGARRPHKNVVTLVRALALLPEDLRLVLVGPPDSRMADPVPVVAEELGVAHRITHLTHVQDGELIQLYRHAYAFLYPSLVEGFGLPLLEAMAAGTPVVASDIPVFREVGSGGALLVPALDPDAWASAVVELGERERRDELIRKGQRHARTATWTRTTDELLATVRRPVRTSTRGFS